MGLRWCILFILSYSTMAKREREKLLPSDSALPFVSILHPLIARPPASKMR